MARPKKTEGTEVVATPTSEAWTAFTTALAAFRKTPSNTNLEALMKTIKAYQAAFKAQFD